LGLAHIGVLQALEENQIPIHCVTGTSAGALVGGMYAAGFTPREMLELALREAANWLAPGLVVQEEYFFRRSDPDGTFITVPFSLRGNRNRIPNNLFSDSEINFGLMRAMTGAGAVSNYNFDSLFVPYRAIAADIFEKKAVVLREGTLAFAMRASMAVPLFFPPATNDRYRTLFDGGVYDNFPVGPMIDEFAPTFVIGCDVAGPPESRENLEEEGNFFRAMLSHAIDQNSFYKMPSNGFYLAPELTGISYMDFSRTNMLLAYQRGYQSALAAIEELKAQIPVRADSAALAARRRAFRLATPPLKVGSVTITGVPQTERIYAKRLVGLRPGKSLSYDDIHRAIVRLRGEGNYVGVFPELFYNRDSGFYDLRMRLKPSTRFKLRLGGAFFTPTDHQLEFGADLTGNTLLGYQLALNLARGSFTNHAVLRGRIYIPSRRPLMLELTNRVLTWDLQQNILSLFNTENRANVGYSLFEFRPSIGFPLLTEGKFVAGHAYISQRDRFFRAQQPTNVPEDASSWSGQSTFLHFVRHTLNEKMYPTSGHVLYLSARYNQGTETFESGTGRVERYTHRHKWFQFAFDYEKFIRFSRKVTLALHLEAALSTVRPFRFRESTLLISPKFTPLQDSPILFIEGLYSKAFAAPGLEFIINLTDKLSWRSCAYWMQKFHQIGTNADNELVDEWVLNPLNKTFVASTGLVYRTTIGPIGLFGNYYENPTLPFRVFVHLGYLIFQRHALQ
jgi:NTE family protein